MKTLHINLWHAAHNNQPITVGGGVFQPAEIKDFLKQIVALEALAKSLQAQVDILEPVVRSAVSDYVAVSDLVDQAHTAHTALEALAEHRRT